MKAAVVISSLFLVAGCKRKLESAETQRLGSNEPSQVIKFVFELDSDLKYELAHAQPRLDHICVGAFEVPRSRKTAKGAIWSTKTGPKCAVGASLPEGSYIPVEHWYSSGSGAIRSIEVEGTFLKRWWVYGVTRNMKTLVTLCNTKDTECDLSELSNGELSLTRRRN